jgi:hypothetical protein
MGPHEQRQKSAGRCRSLRTIFAVQRTAEATSRNSRSFIEGTKLADIIWWARRTISMKKKNEPGHMPPQRVQRERPDETPKTLKQSPAQEGVGEWDKSTLESKPTPE